MHYKLLIMKNKKIQIIDAAIKLFSQEGVGVATSKIAKQAEVSNGSLFNYFATKQILINEVYINIKTNIAEQVLAPINMDQSLEEVGLNIWLGFARWALKNPQQLATLDLLKSSQLLTEEVKAKGLEAWFGFISKTENAIAQGELRALPINIVFISADSILNGIVQNGLQQKVNINELCQQIEDGFDIFWQGIVANKK